MVEADLAAAREAFEHGASKLALRFLWSAVISSVTGNDRRWINDAIEVAEAIRDQSDGRVREDAAELATYAAYARDHPQAPHLFGLTRRPT